MTTSPLGRVGRCKDCDLGGLLAISTSLVRSRCMGIQQNLDKQLAEPTLHILAKMKGIA